MMETLWTICGWTGFAWWCGVIFAGTVIVCNAAAEALCAKWEDDELRSIAAANEDDDEIRRIERGHELLRAARAGQSDDLPANWKELDSYRSTEEAYTEIRYERDWRP